MLHSAVHVCLDADEMSGMWNYAVVACFNAEYYHFHGGTEINHEETHISGNRLKLGPNG
jgi:hypothetical protein